MPRPAAAKRRDPTERAEDVLNSSFYEKETLKNDHKTVKIITDLAVEIIPILLVDDTEINHTVVKRLTKKLESKSYKYELHSAFDGSQALKKIQETSFKIIFMDYQMPRQNGDEVSKELRKLGVNTPIIVQSSNTREELTNLFQGITNLEILDGGKLQTSLQLKSSLKKHQLF